MLPLFYQSAKIFAGLYIVMNECNQALTLTWLSAKLDRLDALIVSKERSGEFDNEIQNQIIKTDPKKITKPKRIDVDGTKLPVEQAKQVREQMARDFNEQLINNISLVANLCFKPKKLNQ